MIGLLQTLAWCAVAVFGLVTARQVGREWFAHRASVALAYNDTSLAMAASSRQIAQIEAESRIAVAQQGQPALLNQPPRDPAASAIPDDLEAYVMTWNDQFAQDDERDAIRAKFKEVDTGDPTETWQRVRRAVGIGELP